MSAYKKILTGWGNYPRATCYVDRPERFQQLTITDAPLIARGLGRSYGDAALNSDHRVILMERLNRFFLSMKTLGSYKLKPESPSPTFCKSLCRVGGSCL